MIVAFLLLPLASAPGPLIAPKAAAASEQVFDQYIGPQSADYSSAYTNEMLAQSFVASAGYKVTRIELRINDLGTDSLALLSLAANNPVDNTPGLAVIGSSANGPDGWDWVSFAIPDVPGALLTAGSVYWIILMDPASNNPNGCGWAKRTTNPMYPSGEAATCSGSNCKWQSDPNSDFLFMVFGINGPSIDSWCEVNAAFAGTGDPLNYTIHFDNTGNQYAPNLWINMSLSGELEYQSDDSTEYGGARTSPNWVFKNVVVGLHSFHINVTVGLEVSDGDSLWGNFTFQYSDNRGEMQEDRRCSVVTIARVPSLTMYKEVAPMYSVRGGTLEYTITFTNSGSRPAGTVWVNDTLPTALDYSFDTAANGTGPGNTSGILAYKSFVGNVLSLNFTNVISSTYRFIISARINTTVLNGTSITNCASLNYTDSSGRVIGPVMACATARVEGASIHVKQEALDNPVARDDALRYQVSFDNEGTASSAFVWINDTLPAGVTYLNDTAWRLPNFNSTLSRRDSSHLYYVFTSVQTNNPLLQPRYFVVTVLVGQSVNDGDSLCNRAELAYADWDGSILSPSSAYSCADVMIPNIILTVQGTPEADPGDFVTYNVTIDNVGSGIASSISFRLFEAQQLNYYYDDSSVPRIPPLEVVRISAQVWQFADVGHRIIVLTFTYKLRVGLPDGMLVTSEFDMNYTDYKGRQMGSEQIFISTTVTAPVITLNIIQNMTEVPRGDEITYTIFYNNTGHGAAKNVWINDTIPDETAFWRSDEQYVATSGVRITWHFVDVARGDHDMTVTLKVDNQATAGSTLENMVDLIYEDGNGNYIDRLHDDIVAKVIDGVDGPPNFFQAYSVWLLVIILLITLACMWLFVGRKFYGLGIKEKARIDELFLLHRSGELIRHHSRSLRADVDSDVLSAMLVAVQNFVKESFNFRAGDLEELKFGNQKITLIHGEHVILAAVVAGPFPQRLEPGMRTALEEIESRFGSSLEDWSGITEDLPEVDDILSGVFDTKAG